MDETGRENARRCGRLTGPNETLLADLNPDVTECAILAIARHYFATFSGQCAQGWMAAMAQSERAFGPETGPIVAARMLAGLKVMRRNRRLTFMFNSPTCPRCAGIVTTEERLLLRGIMALRRGHAAAARLEFMLLCDGNVEGAERVAVAFLPLVAVLSLPDPVPQRARADGAHAR